LRCHGILRVLQILDALVQGHVEQLGELLPFLLHVVALFFGARVLNLVGKQGLNLVGNQGPQPGKESGGLNLVGNQGALRRKRKTKEARADAFFLIFLSSVYSLSCFQKKKAKNSHIQTEAFL